MTPMGEHIGSGLTKLKKVTLPSTIESIDKAEKAFTRANVNAFEKDVWVYVPDGNIGVVKTVEPIAIEGGQYGSFYGGKLLLTVGVDYVKKCQSYNTEMTSLVIPSVPQYMWYLFPNA